MADRTSTTSTTTATTTTTEAALRPGEPAKKKYRLLAGRHVEHHPTRGTVLHQHRPGRDTVVESHLDLPVLFPNKFAEVGKEAPVPEEVGGPVVDAEISGDDVTGDFPGAGEKGVAVFRQGDRFAARRPSGAVVADNLSRKRMEDFVAATEKE